MLVADDLQWADPSGLALLDLASARIDQLRMVLAYRPEETDSGHPLEMLVDDVARTNEVIRIQLGGLDQSALATLTTDDTLAAAIVGGTDRSPLAVSEALTALATAGLISHDGRTWHRTDHGVRGELDAIVAAGQQRTISLRASRQPAQRRDLLACLALVGRQTAAGLLAAALDRDQTLVLADLDRLHVAALVRSGERAGTPPTT